MLADARKSPGERLNNRVKGRCEQQTEQSDTEHPKEHGRSQGLAHFRAGAGCDRERHHTEGARNSDPAYNSLFFLCRPKFRNRTRLRRLRILNTLLLALHGERFFLNVDDDRKNFFVLHGWERARVLIHEEIVRASASHVAQSVDLHRPFDLSYRCAKASARI